MVNHTMFSDDEDSQEDHYVNYKQKYRELKKNLRYLIYENECFQDELRKAQHNFVCISRDKSFLLDRILKYEKPQGYSSDSEATESSDEDEETKVGLPSLMLQQKKKISKKKKTDIDVHNGSVNVSSENIHGSVNSKQVPLKPLSGKPASGKGMVVKKNKRPPTSRRPSGKKEKEMSKATLDTSLATSQMIKNYDQSKIQVDSRDQSAVEEELSSNVAGVEFGFSTMTGSEGHLTREEVERHLESRRFSPELNTTATVPAELFSHEPEPESDFEEGEMCEFIQLEEDAISANVILE